MLARQDVAALFPAADITVLPRTAIPGALTDPEATRILTTVGIPDWLVDGPGPLVTVADVRQNARAAPEPGAGELFYLSYWGYGIIGICAESGAIIQAYNRDLRPVASGLAPFLRVAGFMHQRVHVFERGGGWDYLEDSAVESGHAECSEFFAQLQHDTVRHLYAIDPVIASAAEQAWRDYFEDTPGCP